MMRAMHGNMQRGGFRWRGEGGEVYRSGDTDVVTAVEENNLCVCEMVTNAKRGRRGQRNQRGERNSEAKLSERRGESWGRMADGIFRYVFMVLPQMTGCEHVARVFIGREEVPVVVMLKMMEICGAGGPVLWQMEAQLIFPPSMFLYSLNVDDSEGQLSIT